MSKKKKNLILLIALIVIFCAVSATVAYDSVETRTRNIITTGSVDISINETSPTVGDLVKAKAGNSYGGMVFTDIYPGQTASKVLNIRNNAEKCWLRVKIEKSVAMANGQSEPADFQDSVVLNCDSTTGNWKYDNGYYYYTKPLEKDESTATPLFDTVLFAPGMGNEYTESTVTITVTAEAIQYRNNENGTLAWKGGGA